jgi:hypothetical protein
MTLIRTYKITEQVPSRKLFSVIKDSVTWAGLATVGWEQRGLTDRIKYGADVGQQDAVGARVTELRDWFILQCPIKHTQNASIVVHRLTQDVPTHNDRMSKSCFLFPIKVGNNVRFGVEDKEVILEVGKMYRFNDHKDHYVRGISRETILVIVDFNTCW